MRPSVFHSLIIDPALKLLPAKMDTLEARAMLLAVAYQESGLIRRRQIEGPARGWWQFEQQGGVRGVMQHQATFSYSARICSELSIPWIARSVYEAIEFCDLLSASFARLLLWTHPEPLPYAEVEGWKQYLEVWRPGKPRVESWSRSWNAGVSAGLRIA